MTTNALLRMTVRSLNTGKVSTRYMRAGWTDNNVPLCGPKSRVHVLKRETAETICANLNRRMNACIENFVAPLTTNNFRMQVLKVEVEPFGSPVVIPASAMRAFNNRHED